jgi:uncharacterized protein with HEPN domain
MYDRDLVREILSRILEASDTVIYRSAPVKSLADLTDSPSGMEKLDAICMQLIAIGEGLKNVDKITNNSLLHQYPEINWKGAKVTRNIITHHYFQVDAEIIFEVCQNKIKPLRDTIKKILDSI